MVIGGISSLCREHPAQTSAPSMRLLRLPPPILLDAGEAALSGGESANRPGERLPAIVHAKSPYLFSSSRNTAIMAEINKLSVEKALDKLRAGDAKQSKDTLFNNKIDALDEEIERIRTQRRRLEQHQRRRDR